jgi:hypothetical protein
MKGSSENPMDLAAVEALCRRAHALMDETALAIQRRDLDAVEAADGLVMPLLAEIEARVCEAGRVASVQASDIDGTALERLRFLLCEARERTDRDLALLARWSSETQADWAGVIRGGRMLNGYAWLSRQHDRRAGVTA